MAKKEVSTPAAKARTRGSPGAIMEQPPRTEKELAQQREIGELLSGLADKLQQQNLDNAVRLAQQAARHQGELVDHFAELGRRFASSLDKPALSRLRLIDGGAA